MDKINPDMIKIARESRGLSQTELAGLISVSQGKISKIESGLLSVSDEMLQDLSRHLSYPASFFSFDDKVYGYGISGIGILYHRKRQNLSNEIIDRLHAQINIRRMHLVRLLKSVEIKNNLFRPFDIDEYDGKIEDIARNVRASWMLPNGPIKNLTKGIEDAGGIVIEFDFGTKKVDAISQWTPGLPPLFFTNTNAPGDRLRFSLAHELGHIFMHRLSTPNMEEEADKFAGEFLVPSHEISSSLNFVTLQKLANLKPHWKVSMASLLYRASELNKVTKRQYQYLWMQMGKAGYRTVEPPELEIPRERPTLLQELMNTYRTKLNYSLTELSTLLGLFEDEIKTIYFDQKTPHLTLVK
jgi:Zn-dependent peptidase ImmA (M78 family)/transcriptional regulator with XRE-family HTH domain